MFVKSIRIFVVLFLVFCITGKAQTAEQKKQRKIDSLRRMLVLAKHDTDKIRLRYQVGKEMVIKRVSYWDSLLADSRKHKTTRYEIKALLGLGFCYQKQHDFQKSIIYLEQARGIAEKKGYRVEQLIILDYLITSYTGTPYNKRVLDLYYEGLRLAEELDHGKQITNYYLAIGNYYFFADDPVNALRMHEKGLAKARKIIDSAGIISTLIDIGSDYHALKDDKKAAFYYLESRKYVKPFAGTKKESEVFNSVAAAYEFMQMPDSAIAYSLKALEISRQLNDPYGMASAMTSLADRYFQKGDIPGAKKMANEALLISKSTSFAAEIPVLALLLKKIYMQENNFEDALRSYELYVNTRDSISNEKTRTQALQKEFDYNIEKKENENNLLAQKNQIQELRLSQNRYFFWGLGGLVLLVAVIAWLLLRQNKLRAQQQNIKLEQKLLYSQMNPHFIFNSLNSIQQFVLIRENDKAELYLSKFAKLIRELLENSTAESVSVNEEVDILTGYLEMEALRFSHSFNYTITVDEKLDTQHTQIPHMMIQPFIENAIWHGLLAKSSDRNLVVVFKPATEGLICCEIDDNGVGRDASTQKQSRFKKKSLALDFVQQRLRLMRKAFRVDCNVTIIDKKNEAGESLGTKIVLLLPILPTADK